MKVYNIIFLQNEENLHRALKDINRSLPRSERCKYFHEISDTDLINYLQQWHQDDIDCYECNTRDIEDLDSEFLGYRIDKDNDLEGYLFSRNNNLGYCGLSYFQVETHQTMNNYINFELPIEAIEECSHQGRCDDDVKHWQEKLNLNLDRNLMILELKETGSWDSSELNSMDNDELERKIIWLSACTLNDEVFSPEHANDVANYELY